jgi:hypothetical protein
MAASTQFVKDAWQGYLEYEVRELPKCSGRLCSRLTSGCCILAHVGLTGLQRNGHENGICGLMHALI